MICKKTYSRRNQRYNVGENYDVTTEQVAADELYYGETLWEAKAKKKAAAKTETSKKAPAKKAPAKKEK